MHFNCNHNILRIRKNFKKINLNLTLIVIFNYIIKLNFKNFNLILIKTKNAFKK